MVGENFGETGVLGQKAVPGMYGIGASDLAGCQQRRDVEVAVLRWRRSDTDAFVRKPDMHGVGIGGGMHRDGRYTQLLAGAQDTQGDLAAIGYQDLVEHHCVCGSNSIIQ